MLESPAGGEPVNMPVQLKCWKYKELDKGGLEDGKCEQKRGINGKDMEKVLRRGNK